MLDLIRDIILATDLAHHLRIFKDLQKMADGMFPVAQCAQTRLCCCFILTTLNSKASNAWFRLVKPNQNLYFYLD